MWRCNDPENSMKKQQSVFFISIQFKNYLNFDSEEFSSLNQED